MRAAILTRVSTRDQGQDTENQAIQLRQFCEAQGWEIVHEYEDHQSGSTSARAQFQAMMREASQRRFDVLLFWSLDRLTREGALPTLQYLNTLSGYGVGFRSSTEPYLDSCGMFKDAIIAILGTIAKQERTRIKERVMAGLERYRQDYRAGRVGKEIRSRSGRNLPVGRPRRVFDRQRVAELRAQGLSYRQIASRLGVGEGTVRRVLHASTDETEARQNAAVVNL